MMADRVGFGSSHATTSLENGGSGGRSSQNSSDFSTISKCRQMGFSFISQALRCEEMGKDLDLAPTLYKLGIKELENGISLCGADDQDVQIFQIRREMLSSLSRAKDRCEILNHAAPGVGLQAKQASVDLSLSPDEPRKGYVKSTVGFFEKQKSQEGTTPTKQTNVLHFSRPTLSSILKSRERSHSPNPSPILTDRKSSKKVSANASTPKSVHGPRGPTTSRTKGGEYSEFLLSTMVEGNFGVSFNDVIGHKKSKQALKEMVILPSLRPELFDGLRSPAKGLLLFGPPGNGKTLLAKALAHESNSTLFNITAASLTSKYVGDGEKLVKELFRLAAIKAPSIIFIDEIDSILCSRKENDHEASRRLKTEFFANFDGLLSGKGDRIIVVGATNRPQDLDDAALRRFSKRIFVELPDLDTRIALLTNLLSNHSHRLSRKEIEQVSRATVLYSCSDITNLAREAALGPLRELGPEKLLTITSDLIRPVQLEDFRVAFPRVRSSVNSQMLASLELWNKRYGDVS